MWCIIPSGRVIARGSWSCWFAVESKTFECLVERIGRRIQGVILESSRGHTLWIRFGESSLRSLLEGVESCCREEEGKVVKRWEEKGRRLCLETHTNGAWNYILCLVLDLEAKGNRKA